LAYDVQDRLTLKQHPDTSTVAYSYETTTSRLKSVTDALSQVKTYAWPRAKSGQAESASSPTSKKRSVPFFAGVAEVPAVGRPPRPRASAGIRPRGTMGWTCRLPIRAG
jgi:YD repeat-containing protein